MELFLPEQIALNETSKALLADVEETARRVNEYRPLPEPVVQRIQDELLGERVYSSNAIEGNTLDLRETITVLETGRLLEGRKREAKEALNLGHAVKAAGDLVPLGSNTHTAEQLCKIHQIILSGIDEQAAGRYRTQRVKITGARHQPPDHTIVAPLVDRVLERLRKEDRDVPGLILAVWSHWALARIHPFKDGNGRVARLWQDLVLFQKRLTCAVTRPEQRREYIMALANADDGEFNPLTQLTAQRVLTTFDKYLSEIAHDDELDSFVKELTGVIDDETGQKDLIYQRWARKMEQLRWEFELCGARISEASENIRVRVLKQPLIDRNQWANIRLGRSLEKPPFFSLAIARNGAERRYDFAFTKNSSLAPTGILSEVALTGIELGDLIPSKQVHLTGSMFDRRGPDVWVLEVAALEEGFSIVWCPEATPKSQSQVMSAMRIAQDFIREVVLHRLT